MSEKAERDVLLGHEDEADGIREYDNPLPDWWLGLFWGTVLFAVAYTVHYHFIAHRSYPKALARELAEVRADAAAAGGTEGTAVTTEISVAAASAGATVFQQYCASCHGANLAGGIGPSLVDAEWVHGGTPEQIRATIASGVLDKGMPGWGPILGAERVNEAVAYVMQQNAAALGLPFPPQHEESEEPGDEHAEGREGPS